MALNFQLGRHGFMKQIRILKMGALTALVMASALGLGGAAWAQLSQEDAASAGLSSMGSFKGVDTTKGLDATRLGTPSIRQIDVGRSAQMQPEAAPVRALPLVPNDFQKFVQDATGQNLPLFGAEFFRQSGAFASSQSTPVTSDYRIGAGDEVLIRGWGSVDIDVRTAVDRNGLIFIPRVGSVPVAGLQSSQLEPTIRAAIARYYRDFQLSVTQGQIRGITVYMVGQARQPGAYTLPGTSTLVSALFATGGPNNLGSMRHIQVKRGSQVVTELDLYDFIAKGDKRADVRLQDGDTILIPAAAGFVGLIGKVSSPAVYELANEQETIGQLLAVAGGLLVVADPKKAYLERMDPSRKPSRSVESFALDAAGMNKPMKRGDLLTVQALTTEFGNAVTLRGNVSQPARMPWREGMRVRDLIPNKAVLMSKESVSRQNGVLLKDNENEATLASRIGNLVEEVNLEYAVIERVNASDVTVKLLPFNLGAALEDDNGQDNLPLQPGDVITVFSVSDVRVPPGQAPGVCAGGRRSAPSGCLSNEPGRRLGQVGRQSWWPHRPSLSVWRRVLPRRGATRASGQSGSIDASPGSPAPIQAQQQRGQRGNERRFGCGRPSALTSGVGSAETGFGAYAFAQADWADHVGPQ
jgi:protein involved in polysaccharide export with SLBB domain